MNKAGGSGDVEKLLDFKGWGKINSKKIKAFCGSFPSIHSLLPWCVEFLAEYMGAPLKILFLRFSLQLGVAYDQVLGNWMWVEVIFAMSNLCLSKTFLLPLASVWNWWQKLEQPPWIMNCTCTLRRAKQQDPATYQPATAYPDLFIREKKVSLFLSLCICCSHCNSCLTFSLTNTSSFSCSKHKALTPNVISPMKAGQYPTGEDLILACLCLLVHKISKKYLSFEALSHCTRGSKSRVNCCTWN